jgi:D-arabinose 1-dehydrogenase-like Zn-dependent alcohol dehydrogenase
LTLEEAGPLLCAGITTFNSLRNGPARAGDVVGVVGLGGLGHLAVQFASRMGFRTVGISRGKDKEEFAKKLGAHHYIDSTTQVSYKIGLARGRSLINLLRMLPKNYKNWEELRWCWLLLLARM